MKASANRLLPVTSIGILILLFLTECSAPPMFQPATQTPTRTITITPTPTPTLTPTETPTPTPTETPKPISLEAQKLPEGIVPELDADGNITGINKLDLERYGYKNESPLNITYDASTNTITAMATGGLVNQIVWDETKLHQRSKTKGTWVETPATDGVVYQLRWNEKEQKWEGGIPLWLAVQLAALDCDESGFKDEDLVFGAKKGNAFQDYIDLIEAEMEKTIPLKPPSSVMWVAIDAQKTCWGISRSEGTSDSYALFSYRRATDKVVTWIPIIELTFQQLFKFDGKILGWK